MSDPEKVEPITPETERVPIDTLQEQAAAEGTRVWNAWEGDAEFVKAQEASDALGEEAAEEALEEAEERRPLVAGTVTAADVAEEQRLRGLDRATEARTEAASKQREQDAERDQRKRETEAVQEARKSAKASAEAAKQSGSKKSGG